MEFLKENLVKILLAVITVMGGTLIGDLSGFWDLSKKRDDSYIEKYIKEVKQSNEQISQLTAQLYKVKQRQRLIEVVSDIPFPYWFKDKNSVIAYVSSKFVEDILNPMDIRAEDLIHTNGTALGGEIVESFMKNDAEVMLRNEVIGFWEDLPNGKEGLSIKFPITNRFNELRGVGGIWIDKKYIVD